MIQPRAAQRFAEYLTVGQAAEFLGVSTWTLRNWDKAGTTPGQIRDKSGTNRDNKTKIPQKA